MSLPKTRFSLTRLNLIQCRDRFVRPSSQSFSCSFLRFETGLDLVQSCRPRSLPCAISSWFSKGPVVTRRLRLGRPNRPLWVWLSRLWSGWRSALLIVKPETVIAWHRQGFRLYWSWKSRHPASRPSVPREVIDLIHKMSLANPRWGAPRIHGELLKLGFELSQATVAKYMVRLRRPPSQTSRAFLQNHAKDLVATDFFVVPTVFFDLLYVFVILSHDRRRVVNFGVTAYPTSERGRSTAAGSFPVEQRATVSLA